MTMKTTPAFTILFLLVGTLTSAQERPAPQSVAFRLTEWKNLHFDDVNEAQQQLQTLKKLGCEAETEPHAGHTDVRFRATRWAKVSLDTRKVADQWERWLKTNGFETLRGHNEAPAPGAVAVHYTMVQSRTMHLNKPEEAQEFTALFTGLGCDVRQAQHNGHRDLTISCPQWRNVIFDGHEEAHAFQKWLDEQGFQTQHNH